MPWHETEALFQSTLRAAKDASPDDENFKAVEVVDLGEAGRREIWRSDSRSISKTIAKHGGTYTHSASPRLASGSDCGCRRLDSKGVSPIAGTGAPHPSDKFATQTRSFILWLQRPFEAHRKRVEAECAGLGFDA